MGTQIPGHGGGDRASNQVALLESTIKVVCDEATDLLRT
jgi:hypothetical protein